ncbi:UNVERIFIED_ORG: hypothetical protein FNL38_10116 [Nocardia globerula]|uniref:Uncharacterized protein n=1 Tax=Nocardia globerula TaxID=1818 RepID=A0A652YVD0_NOCGL|nr:hypothetical protein C8E04_1218 [Rhodococcus globerulus]
MNSVVRLKYWQRSGGVGATAVTALTTRGLREYVGD